MSWPPATASRSGTSRRLPLQLHPHTEASTHKSGEQRCKKVWQEPHLWIMCALPPAWRGEMAFLVRDGRPELSWSKEKQRRRKTGRPRRAMTVDPPRRDTGLHLVLLWKELHTRGGWIYSGPLCASLVTQHALAPEICYCPTIGKRWERWKGGAVNNEPLCLAFQKYLLGTSCTEQYSHLIPQTGNPLSVWLSKS